MTASLFEARQLRANTYGLLARLIAAPPDQDLLQALTKTAPTPPEAGNNIPPLAQAWQKLAEKAGSTAADTIAEEFEILFIGLPRGKLLPYASHYRTGFLMEKPLARLRGDLKRLGFERQAGVGEPEDHAAALLEVMGLLTAGGEDARAREFFAAHLAPWFDRFWNDLELAPSAQFYPVCARLGRAFMDIEKVIFEAGSRSRGRGA